MLSRKAKLGVVTLLLGTPTGASISTLDLSKLSLDSLLSSSGGGRSSNLEERDYSLEQKLKIDSTLQEVRVNEQKEVLTPTLKEIREEINLKDKEKLSQGEGGVTIKTIFSETKKEGATIQLERESSSTTKKYIAQSSKWVKDYHSAKSKVDSFFQSQSLRRRKRSLERQTILTLSIEERNALLEMIKLFEEIEKERDSISPKLEKIEPTQKIIKVEKERPRKEVIETNLKQLDWTTQKDIKYEFKPSKTKLGRSAPASSSFSDWSVWTQNPFHVFLDQRQDYDYLIQRIKQAQNSLKISERRGLIQGGMRRAYVWPDEDIQRRRKSVEQAKTAVSMRVAAKLLTWMEQYNSPAGA